jgi:hypothetical protein
MEDKPTMIKRCFSICVLLFALVLPIFGGVVKPGGAYCEPVDNVTCFEDGSGSRRAAVRSGGEIKDTSSASPQGDVLDGLFVFALALFMVYRMRL